MTLKDIAKIPVHIEFSGTFRNCPDKKSNDLVSTDAKKLKVNCPKCIKYMTTRFNKRDSHAS